MRIAEFEKKVGLSRDTLRYYEKIGVLTPPQRDANGYRHYGQVQLEELAFIEKGKLIGFSLPAIRAGWNRYKKLGHFCPEFSKQLNEKRAMLTERMAKDQHSIQQIDALLAFSHSNKS